MEEMVHWNRELTLGDEIHSENRSVEKLRSGSVRGYFCYEVSFKLNSLQEYLVKASPINVLRVSRLCFRFSRGDNSKENLNPLYKQNSQARLIRGSHIPPSIELCRP